MEPVQLAKIARESLASALNAIQSCDDAPDELFDAAEPIAQTITILRKIERGGGAMLDGRDIALKNVRKILADVQNIDTGHPATDEVLEAVASSLAKVNALARWKVGGGASVPPPAQASVPPPAEAPAPKPVPAPAPAPRPEPAPVPVAAKPEPAPAPAPAPRPAPAAPTPRPEPAPAPVAAKPEPAPAPAPRPAPAAPAPRPEPAPAPVAAKPEPAPAPAPRPAAPAPSYDEPRPVLDARPTPAPQPQPVAQPKPAPAPAAAPQPVVQAKPVEPKPEPAPAPPPVVQAKPVEPKPEPAPAPQPVVQAKPAEPKVAPKKIPAPAAPPGVRTLEVSLGTRSVSNFYRGLGGNDVIDHGGVFVETYRIPPIGTLVQLHVHMPGDYEFYALARVMWTRDPGGSSEPGFGARFSEIGNDGRQLVYRYSRIREPMFYDDL